MDTQALVAFVESELAAIGDAERATQMAAYMKTDMPFFGVQSKPRRAVFKEAKVRFPVEGPDDYVDAVEALWDRPHRETKYVGIDYATAHKSHCVIENIDLYERLIVEGAWWDFVDVVAAHLVGGVLRNQRQALTPLMYEWVSDDDMWIRRSSIICQLRHKDETDENLLYGNCLARMHEKEFFIRKAIGWALRDYSWFEPESVRAFVLEHRTAMSGLTYREATKRLDNMPPHKS